MKTVRVTVEGHDQAVLYDKVIPYNTMTDARVSSILNSASRFLRDGFSFQTVETVGDEQGKLLATPHDTRSDPVVKLELLGPF